MKRMTICVAVLFLSCVLSVPVFAGKGGGGHYQNGGTSGQSGSLLQQQSREQNQYRNQYENQHNMGLNEAEASKMRNRERIENTERQNAQHPAPADLSTSTDKE